jgi:hypothetical protein
MVDVGVGVSFEKNELAAVEEAIRQAKSKKKSKEDISLCLVFCSLDYQPAAIVKNLNILLEETPILGATAKAFFSSQCFFKQGLLIALFTFPEGIFFNTASAQAINQDLDMAEGEALGEKLLYGFKNVPRSLSLLFFNKLLENTNFVSGLQERLGKSFPCLGFPFSETTDDSQARIFYGDKLLDSGCAGILWGGKINFGLGIKHGWKPLGKPHDITRAEENLILKIDDKPASQLYEEYLAYNRAKLRKELKTLSILYPLGVRMPQSNDYLLRNVRAIKADGALDCKGTVNGKEPIRLMISTQETRLKAIQEATEEAKEQLAGSTSKYHKDTASQVVLAFNSQPKATIFKRAAKQEFAVIKSAFKPNTPIIGVYTYGALAPLNATAHLGQTYFHSQSISILIIEG